MKKLLCIAVLGLFMVGVVAGAATSFPTSAPPSSPPSKTGTGKCVISLMNPQAGLSHDSRLFFIFGVDFQTKKDDSLHQTINKVTYNKWMEATSECMIFSFMKTDSPATLHPPPDKW